MPTELPPTGKHRNKMSPLGLELHHSAYEMLLKYATGGCPVKTGQNCTNEEIQYAVMIGPYEYTLADEDISHFSDEYKGKVALKRARLVQYYKIKGELPKK